MAVEQGNAKETLLGVLTYIDSPFKLGVVILLAFLGFAGFFVYQHQEVMVGAYIKNKERPVMNPDRFEPAARLILKSTGAEMVVIFHVDTFLESEQLRGLSLLMALGIKILMVMMQDCLLRILLTIMMLFV